MLRIFTLLLVFFLAMTNISICQGAGADATIYFYNPETNIDNFSNLKKEFDEYLSDEGNYEFQPFDNQKAFEQNLNKKGNVFLLSSWHFDALVQQKIPLQIALIGTFHKIAKQKKILNAKKNITRFTMLKNTVVAGAGSEDYIRSILQQIDGAQYSKLAKNITILTVPKDSDALSAIGFGAASAAVFAENNLKILESFNSSLYKQLHNLGSSEANYLLIVATLGKPTKEESKLIEVLYNMAQKETNHKLNMLGLDGWQRK